MRSSFLPCSALGRLAATLVVLLSPVASAQTNSPTITCYDPSARPNVVYVSGSSAVRPFMGALAKLLSQQSPPYYLVYQAQGSCVGVNSIYSADPNQRLMRDIPPANGKPANYAIVFSLDGNTAQECYLDPGGNAVDVGVSDVYAATCGATAPTGVSITDFEGPIQPMTFVVPAASTQRSLSAEAAYVVFGRHGDTGKPLATNPIPWTDPASYFVRNSSSGTQQLLAQAIGVAANDWWGVDRGSSAAVRDNLKQLAAGAAAEKAIGILSTDIADEERANLRILAFQARGQSCGYLPDSSSTSTDKANVRDGHYPLWGPVHFFTRTNSAGVPLSTPASALVSRFADSVMWPPLVEAISRKHLVPRCAMKVKRSAELGPLSAYTTDARCDCFFALSATGTAPASCKACAGPSECSGATPSCSYGFCEATQ